MGVKTTRNLGIDVGDKRIGLALSDPMGVLASPLTIIDGSDETAAVKAIADIIEQHQVGQIIVGLPRSMDGSVGRQAEKVKAFVEKLRNHTEVPVEFRDERLSTVSAKRLMLMVGKPVKSGVDAVAAALILQSYLDEAY